MPGRSQPVKVSVVFMPVSGRMRASWTDTRGSM